MFLKKNWLPITVFLLAIVAVGLYLLTTQQTPKDPVTIIKPVEVEKQPKPPPPGETFETGHWHGDVWHTGSHETHANAPEVETQGNTPPSDVSLKNVPGIRYNGKLFHELTPKERAKIWEKAYRENMGGAAPPPDILKAAEKEFQDILKSLDEPKVTVRLVDGFAPTPEQLERYLALEAESREAWRQGDQLRYDALQAEIDEMRATIRGKVPAVSAFAQGKKAISKKRQAMKEAEAQAYRDLGLGHMVEAGVSGLPLIRPTVPAKLPQRPPTVPAE